MNYCTKLTQQPRQSYRPTEEANNSNESQSRRNSIGISKDHFNFPLSNDLKFLQTMRRIDQQIASRRSLIPSAAESISDRKLGHDSSGRFDCKGRGINESPKFDLFPDFFDGCETINEEELHHNDSLDYERQIYDHPVIDQSEINNFDFSGNLKRGMN